MISKKKTKTQKYQKQKQKWVTVTFLGKEAYYIAEYFKKTDLNVGFKTNGCINHLLKPKYLTKKENFYLIDVYQLKCPDCGKKYTGQTGRYFEKRYKENLFSFRSNNNNWKCVQPVLENGHSFGKINDFMEVLHLSSKGAHVDTIENFCIYSETIKGINGKHEVSQNNIFETVLKRESHLTSCSSEYSPRQSVSIPQ